MVMYDMSPSCMINENKISGYGKRKMQVNEYHMAFLLLLQVIIPCVWISSSILNIPSYMVLHFDKTSNSCGDSWPKKWMVKAFTLMWDTFAVFSMVLMVVLYSKVVYTLWFKRSDNNQLTYQQKVRVNSECHYNEVCNSPIYIILRH